jgi:hypothetical protein
MRSTSSDFACVETGSKRSAIGSHFEVHTNPLVNSNSAEGALFSFPPLALQRRSTFPSPLFLDVKVSYRFPQISVIRVNGTKVCTNRLFHTRTTCTVQYHRAHVNHSNGPRFQHWRHPSKLS